MTDILVGRGQRAAIIGSTGAGKTVMLLEQIKHFKYQPIYILNTKGDENIINFIHNETGKNNAVTVHSIKDMAKQGVLKSGTDYIHILPPRHELSDAELLDNYLGAIYDINRPCLVAIDEIYQVNVGLNGGPGLNGLLTRGRSKGISVICCSQRPAFMSKFVVTESQLFIIYRLNNPQDYQKLRDMGIPFPKEKTLDKFYFFMYKSGDMEGKFYNPIELKNDIGYSTDNNFKRNFK